MQTSPKPFGLFVFHYLCLAVGSTLIGKALEVQNVFFVLACVCVNVIIAERL